MKVIAERLRTAIERQELRLVYQPIVRMEDGEVNALEALIRWSPDGVEVPPSDFIPVAEGIGLIHRVGAWVLETACRQIRALTAADPARTPMVVHVNVSPFQLDDECWPDQVRLTLERTGLAPEQLMLELTESKFIGDDGDRRRQLLQVAMLGVQIAVDDFGAGYSALAYLPRLPLHLIKLDRQFVIRVGEDQVARALVTSVAQLTRTLRIDSVAEGVETPAQASALARMGYAMAQGHLFSPPVEYPDLLDSLSAVERRTRAASLAVRRHSQCPPSPRVLLVDDDSNALELMRVLLAQCPDLQVQTVNSVEVAVEQMNQDSPPDLIITDLCMSPYSGIELARAIRATSRGRVVTVVAITGHPEMLGQLGDRKLFNQVVSKPIHPESFAATVHGWVDQPGLSLEPDAAFVRDGGVHAVP